MVGISDGFEVGLREGLGDGALEGACVGSFVVGERVGSNVGAAVGPRVGSLEGLALACARVVGAPDSPSSHETSAPETSPSDVKVSLEWVALVVVLTDATVTISAFMTVEKSISSPAAFETDEKSEPSYSLIFCLS